MKIFTEASKLFVSAMTIISVVSVFNETAFAQKNAKNSPKNNASKATAASSTAADFDSYTFRIFTLINAERAKSDLSVLVWDDDVAKIALEYSRKMARENFFGHFDADGKSVLDRARAARLKRWRSIGENLFSIEATRDFDRFAVKNWMRSPTHRDNILNAAWTTTGIGIARAESGEIFITQIFIKR